MYLLKFFHSKHEILQMFSCLHGIILGLNLTTFNVKISILVLEVKMPLGVIIICHYIGIAGVFSILFIIFESVLILYWMEFVWKTVKPIDDKFVIVWLTLVNIFISSFLSILTILTGRDGSHFTGQQLVFTNHFEIRYDSLY